MKWRSFQEDDFSRLQYFYMMMRLCCLNQERKALLNGDQPTERLLIRVLVSSDSNLKLRSSRWSFLWLQPVSYLSQIPAFDNNESLFMALLCQMLNVYSYRIWSNHDLGL